MMNITPKGFLLRLVITLALLLVGLAIFKALGASSGAIYVSPLGSGSRDGSSAANAVAGLQAGLDKVQAGGVVYLADGLYAETVKTKRSGTKESPIVITGGAGAVLNGRSGGAGRTFEINHDYYTLEGFTIDGKHGATYQDKLIYLLGTSANHGPTLITIHNMVLKNAGGECIRLRYFVTLAQIYQNKIGPCGIQDFVLTPGSSKNGEGIYVGTSSEQWADGKNPTKGPDITRDNHIYQNWINTQANECIDIKEGATANLIVDNDCSGGKDPESGGIDSRGSGNFINYNTIHDTLEAGIRLGGHTVNGVVYGVNNSVAMNTMRNNKAGGIKIMVGPQTKLCGNIVTGSPNTVFGDYASAYATSAVNPCPTGAPTATAPTPTAPISPLPTPREAPATPKNKLYLPLIDR